MESRADKESRMFVLTDRAYREVKEKGYRTVFLEGTLFETLCQIAARAQHERIECIGICQYDRYFLSCGRLLSMSDMENLLSRYDVVFPTEQTECSHPRACMLLIHCRQLKAFCSWGKQQETHISDDGVLPLLHKFAEVHELSEGVFETQQIDTGRMPEMYERIENLTKDLITRYQRGDYLRLLPIDRAVGFGGKMPVFVCWWQGVEGAPVLVQRCIHRIQQFFSPDKADVRIITFDNYQQYVAFSDVIVDRFNSGAISLTHLSDILRAQLLCRYGGLWIDATYFIWDNRFIDALYQFPFFTQKQGGEENELDIVSGRWANNFMKGPANFPLFGFLVEAYEQYWSKYDVMQNYFLIDYITAVAYQNVDLIRAIIDACPVNNRASQVLADWGNLPYDEEKMQLLLQDTWLFKMTYKKEFVTKTPSGELTFFGKLMEHKM